MRVTAALRVLPPLILLLQLTSVPASADAGGAPSFVPEMTLGYVDPTTGDRVECADGCRRLEIPAGVELEVHIQIHDVGGPFPDGVAWDLWLDESRHPFPGLDDADCRDPGDGRIETACWQALVDRVDWQEWQALGSDLVCIPDDDGGCADVSVRVPLDPDYPGSRGRGVYSVALWVDRYRVVAEAAIFDNFAGPIRVRVVPGADEAGDGEDGATAPDTGGTPLLDGSAGRPYTVLIRPQVAETTFALGSTRSRRDLEFSPAYPGRVTVDIQQAGTWDTMNVEIRKVSTGEVLAETRSKGQFQIEGEITHAQLMDDRRFQVVVSSAQGSRGARGTLTISYPGGAIYRSTR